MTMREAIREKLRKNHVSFADLRDIDGFQGEFVIASSINHNVIFWSGISAEASDILNEMCQAGEFEYQPTTPLTYLIDGAMLSLPQVKSKRNYKTPHWLPVVLVTA